jgi:hypothetical protein
MSNEKYQKVQSFFSNLESDPVMKNKFESLAKQNDVVGFENWVKDSGVDVGVVASLMPRVGVGGELDDQQLDAVAGGGWFAQNGGNYVAPVGFNVDSLTQRIHSAWNRWQKYGYKND